MGLKKHLAFIMALSLLLTSGLVPIKDSAKAAENEYGIENPKTENGLTTWDCIYFGNYWQYDTNDDEIADQNDDKQPIKWRVLSVDGDDALVLADKNLDCRLYNDIDEKVTWEECSLRQWLNEDFYNTAFDENEKDAIMETKVVNSIGFDGTLTEENDTTDKIYILSAAEACNPAYGFPADSSEVSKARNAKNTSYIRDGKFGEWLGLFESDYNGYWLLRTLGETFYDHYSVCSVAPGGAIRGCPLDSEFCVRPVLHINLSSSAWSKAAKLRSDGLSIEHTDAPNETDNPKDFGIHNPRVKNEVTEWDKIKFGSYYQNACFEPEPIKWRVLSVNEDEALLLADKSLDSKFYDEKSRYSITWADCTLRQWLNEDFYDEAFDAEEKNSILETSLTNNDNPEYGIPGGDATTDKIYILSIEDVSNASYGFDTELDARSKSREAANTDYAKCNNLYTGLNGNGEWWLRSPGENVGSAAYVSGYGDSRIYGRQTGAYLHAVRPAMRIKISSSKIKYAGTVDSEGNTSNVSDGIDSPRIENGITTWDCVYFGSYNQSAQFDKKEDIEWRVLSVEGNTAFLISDKGLDAKPYNKGTSHVTWEDSSLREWLNGKFYREAFDEEEKKAILESAVINEDNEVYKAYAGYNTTDKIYLLSVEEAQKSLYGFNSDMTRKAKDTDYARINGAFVDVSRGNVRNSYWWLRTPVNGNSSTVCVFNYGEVNACGIIEIGNDIDNYMTNAGISVRPVLHINLESSVWSKAGTVSSNDKDNVTPTAAPTAVPTAEPAPEHTKSPAPTLKPTASPTIKPTSEPTSEPTAEPTSNPVFAPSVPPNNNQIKPTVSAAIPGSSVDYDDEDDEDAGRIVKKPVGSSGKYIWRGKKAKILSAKNSKKGCVIVKWNKTADMSGCQLAYSTNAKFVHAKGKFVKKSRYKIKKLKKHTVCYVRIRPYKILNNGQKAYGEWSKTKRIKVKK